MQIVLSDFQDQLVRGLSHRMNNILSLFHGYLGLLMDDKNLDPVAKQGLVKIRDGAKAASELMERTNALARPTSVVWRETDLAVMLRQLRPTFASFCPPKVRIAVECAEGLPQVWADASRVRMALVELVRNACEAAKSRVTIQVTATEGRVQGELFQAAEQPEHWLRVSVTDDGPGIPCERAETIYAPFFTTKRNQHSAGLGLTVALGCAQQLRGGLSHTSRPGQTTFELAVPSRVAPATAPELSAVA